MKSLLNTIYKTKSTAISAVYIEIQKGMYGLPQAGMLANKLLKCRLTKHRYYKKSPPYPWLLVTHVATHRFHTGRQRFLSGIRKQ